MTKLTFKRSRLVHNYDVIQALCKLDLTPVICDQVDGQPGMECLPLVMEPESRFYTSPVIVLDFQSLYPSMIIAYNLCFSTCLGKLVPDNPKTLGVTKLSMQPGLLDSLKECMTITPNGVMFVPSEVNSGSFLDS
jgi:DNA polymerase zeta